MGRKSSQERLIHRLSPFTDTGLLPDVPNSWQILQGSFEMAPYVVLPDEDDSERYGTSLLGHPLLRTPIVLAYIGLDHFHVGSGLRAAPRSIIRHLCIVHHQVMPDYDLQLLQTHEGGIERLKHYLKELDHPRPRLITRLHRKLIDVVMPDPKGYRHELIRPGGWIDRAERMDYTSEEAMPDHLRKEFFSLVSFLNHCLSLPSSCSLSSKPGTLLRRMRTKFRKG